MVLYMLGFLTFLTFFCSSVSGIEPHTSLTLGACHILEQPLITSLDSNDIEFGTVNMAAALRNVVVVGGSYVGVVSDRASKESVVASHLHDLITGHCERTRKSSSSNTSCKCPYDVTSGLV